MIDESPSAPRAESRLIRRHHAHDLRGVWTTFIGEPTPLEIWTLSSSSSNSDRTAPQATDAPAANEASQSLLSAIWEGLRGSSRSFTDGDLRRAVIVLAIPMMLEMLMESVFAVVDIYFVAHLGTAAITTVGLTEALLTIVYSLAIGLCMATTATVARRFGQGDKEGASNAAVQALGAGTIAAIVLGIFGAIFAPDLLRLMGAEESVVEHGSIYPRIMFGGNAVIFLLFLLNAVYRGAGDASMAMRSLWLANGINIVLDPCLILGLGPFPELGLQGAAIATTIGRGTAVLFQLWMLGRGTRIRIERRHLRLQPTVAFNLLRISAGGIGQYLVSVASWIVLMRIAAKFGSEALAGYTLGIRVVLFALLPAFGVSNAAATLVGQNLGAGKPDRSEASVWWSGLFCMLFLGGVTGFFVLGADWIVDLFLRGGPAWSGEAGEVGDLEAVRDVATSCLRIISAGFVFYAWGMVTVQSFNGAGDTRTPTAINLVCFWLFQIPMGWFLSMHTSLGVRGVFWAVAIAYSASAVIGVIWFRRGRWKSQHV